jgi:hypothetical protein
MQLSTILIGVSLVLLVALLIAYTVITFIRPKMTTALSPKVGDLNKTIKVGSSTDIRDNFLVPPGATFLIYIFHIVNNKTPFIGKTENPINIFKMGSAVQFQILSGGASTKPRTRLLIQTQGGTNPFEDITISDLPQQKWVQIALVREGRRFTVFYNGIAVGSQRTINFPVVSSSELVIGDSRLRGEYVRPVIVPTPMRVEEIQDDLKSSSDTRDAPYKPFELKSVLDKLKCPNGVFCLSTSKPPTQNPLKMWESPYA